MHKTLFRVNGMECSSCAMRLEGLEDTLPGLQRVKASYHRQQMEVEYDETRVSVAEIVAAAKTLGYDITPL